MKVCDKCRKEIKQGKQVLGYEICETCANHIADWIRKGKKQGLDFTNIFGGN